MAGVGGRRWVKLANALLQEGYNISVFCAQPTAGEKSNWEVSRDIKIKRFPRCYPQILNSLPITLIDKITYKLSLFIIPFFTTGNYYDRGLFWEKNFKVIYEYIKSHSIDYLIVTGGPFSLLYYAAKLKVKHPEIKLITDIRDEWGSKEFYGFGLLNSKRQKEELKRLRYTLQHSDKVLVPYPYLREKYVHQVPSCKDNLCVLPHGVDDLFFREKGAQKSLNKIKLINLGSIHSGQEMQMMALSNGLLNNSITLKFFTPENKYQEIFKKKGLIPDIVQYKKPIVEEKVPDLIAKSDAVLLFIPAHFKDSITTKFMEIIATRTPIVAIGVSGDASDFIIKNRLGIFIPYNNIEDRLMTLRSELKSLIYNDNFNIDTYRFSYQAKDLKHLLESI